MLLSLLICAALNKSWMGRNGFRRFGSPSVPVVIRSKTVNCIFFQWSLWNWFSVSDFEIPNLKCKGQNNFAFWSFWLNSRIYIQSNDGNLWKVNWLWAIFKYHYWSIRLDNIGVNYRCKIYWILDPIDHFWITYSVWSFLDGHLTSIQYRINMI